MGFKNHIIFEDRLGWVSTSGKILRKIVQVIIIFCVLIHAHRKNNCYVDRSMYISLSHAERGFFATLWTKVISGLPSETTPSPFGDLHTFLCWSSPWWSVVLQKMFHIVIPWVDGVNTSRGSLPWLSLPQTEWEETKEIKAIQPTTSATQALPTSPWKCHQHPQFCKEQPPQYELRGERNRYPYWHLPP